MSELQKEYCWSWNDEDYNSGTFSSVEDALSDAAENADDGDDGWRTEVYIGEAHPFKNSDFYPDANWIIEHMGESALDNISECSDDYPDVSKEAKDDLNTQLESMLDSWCEKHGISTSFYRVSNSKLYPIQASKD